MAFALLFSCKGKEDQKEDGSATVKSATATRPPVNLPYTIPQQYDWQWGSQENTRIAMQALKDFETGNTDASAAVFGDSAELRFDGMEGKFPRDTVKTLFQQSRAAYKILQIEMHDYESVKSKDGKEEWVSLWYKQRWQDTKGQWDSLSVMDDIRLMNGKIVVLDEKTRHYGKKEM